MPVYPNYTGGSYCIYWCYLLLFRLDIVCIIALNDKSNKQMVVINAANNINWESGLWTIRCDFRLNSIIHIVKAIIPTGSDIRGIIDSILEKFIFLSSSTKTFLEKITAATSPQK